MQRPLITAKDVAEQRDLVIPQGALLTPLARDLLRKRGVRPRPVDGPGPRPARYVVANWKSHKTIGEARRFAASFRELQRTGPLAAAAVICPPFTAIAALSDALFGSAQVGAQDLSPHDEGAHTGEVAARHLVEAGAAFVIVGHSERRHAGEDDALVRRKTRVALRGGLQPILCVGETRDERQSGRAEAVVRDQLRAVVEGLDPESVRRLLVAYEPRWAIGTGLTPTSDQVAEMLAHVRAVLVSVAEERAASLVPVLYGGSVKPKNAAELLHLPGCAGALVGGAALKPEGFLGILAEA